MTRRDSWRTAIPVAMIAMALILAGCGGGGGGATSSSGTVTPGAPVGPAAVEITLAAAPVTGLAAAAAPVEVAGPSTVPTTDTAYKWPEEIQDPSPRIAHVFMEVVKVSLMPAAEPFDSEDIDQDGNPSASSDKSHFVTIVPDSPIRIDLLRLDNDKRFARFLNRFDSVPAGTYDKIRVYYRNVKVLLANGDELPFHPTANSKFDIHFRQGHELVIPSASDTTQPDGWVKFFRVRIDFVGLKLNVVPRGNGKKGWDACKVILRPQIFAVAGNEILYSVAGTVSNVESTATPPVSGTFDVSFGTGPGYPRIIHAAFDNGTTWAWSDNVLGASAWTVDVVNTLGVVSFRDRATVEAIGRFNASNVFLARDIVFTFPDWRQGTADNVWIPPDNVAFVVRSTADNVVVFPKPGRFTAYYDNAVSHEPLDQSAVDNGVRVKARGYFRTPPSEGIDAYWISIGP